ncbi:MAG: hypothetical protein WDO72_05325 [Pseudomonadota bacterium]
MKRNFCKALPVLWFVCAVAFGDPIHAIADGAYWHHDSGWVFPEKMGEFTRVGMPQDVAGSRDAVAYYARVIEGARLVASVDVYPSDSAASGTTLEAAKVALERELPVGAVTPSEETLALGADGSLRLTHVTYTTAQSVHALYFVAKGDWRVQIKMTIPAADLEARAALDAFVRAQRWELLTGN